MSRGLLICLIAAAACGRDDRSAERPAAAQGDSARADTVARQDTAARDTARRDSPVAQAPADDPPCLASRLGLPCR